MINYIGNIIKNKSRKRMNQGSRDSLVSSVNNLNSSPSKLMINQSKSSSIQHVKNKNPSSLLWVFKVNFNQMPESQNERINSGKNSRNSSENLVNEEISNQMLPKIKNYKITNNYINNRYVQIKNNNQAELESPPINKRKNNIGSAKSPEKNNRLSQGIKTSQETHRKRIIKNEHSKEKKPISSKETIEIKEKEPVEDNKIPINFKENDVSPKKKKFKMLKDKLSSSISKANDPYTIELEVKKADNTESINVLSCKEKSPENIKSGSILAEKKDIKKKRKKDKRKKRKQKKLIEKMQLENDFIDRIKQNLVNLFEKQRINRLDGKSIHL
jgi:hypothetical protein